MCYKCRVGGTSAVNALVPRTGKSKGHLKLPKGEAEPSPLPREQPHIQSACKSVKAPKYHNLDPTVLLIGPPNKAWVQVNGVTTYTLTDMGVQITTIAYSFVRVTARNS